ncbi:MAG TPA: SOS response-associated peptidase family protein, partial [Solirubrobacteraceae bacterium]|nr:SOS response-associated peptidase family protein [Solirubrobacteraceae bacterium]
GFANINAKAEGIENNPAFREAFRQRRCLVPVDNFYEWQKTPSGKQPYAIGLKGGGLMALAGLWETWRSPAGERVRSFAVITTEALLNLFRSAGAEVRRNTSIDAAVRVAVRTTNGRARVQPATGSIPFLPDLNSVGQVRTRLTAGERWIQTIGPRHERSRFLLRKANCGTERGSQKGLFLMRYRWFESISLQRRVARAHIRRQAAAKHNRG